MRRIALFALLLGAANMAYFAATVLLAAIYGGWRVTLDFNAVGEGPVELVLALALTIFLSLATVREARA